MTTPAEDVIQCPRDLAADTPGFAMDFGGSVAKLVYRSKADAEELKNNKDLKHGKLCLIQFTRENLSKCVEFLQEHCDITRSGDTPTEIFTTGVGSAQYKATIEKALNVKMTNIAEMDCFVKAFGYLRANIPAQQFVYEDLENTIAAMEKEMVNNLAMFQMMNEQSGAFGDLSGDPLKWTRTSLSADEPLPESETFPCILAMLGSGFAIMKLTKDGGFTMEDGSNRSGREFIGLGGLLTGAKSYDELISLAEKGDIASVSSTMNSFKGAADADESGDNVYGKVLEKDISDQVVFCFGNAPGKKISDFKREDLALALLHTIVMDLVQMVSQNAQLRGVKKVFLCGGFGTTPFVRKIFTQEFLRRELNPVFNITRGITFHFLKQGQSLGTVGAYINNIDKFSKTPGQEEVEK